METLRTIANTTHIYKKAGYPHLSVACFYFREILLLGSLLLACRHIEETWESTNGEGVGLTTLLILHLEGVRTVSTQTSAS